MAEVGMATRRPWPFTLVAGAVLAYGIVLVAIGLLLPALAAIFGLTANFIVTGGYPRSPPGFPPGLPSLLAAAVIGALLAAIGWKGLRGARWAWWALLAIALFLMMGAIWSVTNGRLDVALAVGLIGAAGILALSLPGTRRFVEARS